VPCFEHESLDTPGNRISHFCAVSSADSKLAINDTIERDSLSVSVTVIITEGG
jgi:hypothetical protein